MSSVKSLINKRVPLLASLLFLVAVVLFYALGYPHHLHYQEQYQLFLFDQTYLWEIVREPGGVADLLGRFSTQFFLYAWVGALIIAVLLSVVQLLTLRLSGSESLYGLSFVPDFITAPTRFDTRQATRAINSDFRKPFTVRTQTKKRSEPESVH